MISRLALGLAAAAAGTVALASYGLSGHRAPPLRSSAAATQASRQNGGLSDGRVDSLFGVFEGRTPCHPLATEFTGFPAANCEKIKWRLTLYRDPATGEPSTYTFDGTRSTRHGRWTIERARGADAGAVVLRLRYGRPEKVLSLLNVDDKVLLLLDDALDVLVGDASWSYVLNRTNVPAR